MSHEEELLKFESFDRYTFSLIRFRYKGNEISGSRFRNFSEFFSSIYNDVIAASTDSKVIYNIHQIGFLNSVRTDTTLIGPEAWEEILRRLDNKNVSLQDIIDWLKNIELLKANFNFNVNATSTGMKNLRF